jgi:hypothetical protein
MSGDSSPDRAAFQQFLESAFAVQESQIDSRFLSAVVGIQRLMAREELGLEGIMNLIVDAAQEVAGAAGVAVGLLERDQLIYRSGSGCSASRIGSRVAASLTVSTKTKPSREILRVENAHTDTRIQGAICRQFGAASLLILPIYGDQALLGVLEILFHEPHTYQDSEVRMYRLMAGLIEEAMGRDSQAKGKVPAVSSVLEETPNREKHFSEGQPLFAFANEESFYERCGAAWAAFRKSPGFRRPARLAEVVVQRATDGIANKPLRSLVLTAVVTGLGLSLWMAHGRRKPTSVGEFSAPSRPAVVKTSQPDVIPVDGTPKGRPLPVRGKDPTVATLRTRRVREGQTEVDYIGDDVTVRHYSYKPAHQRTASHVTYIGDDVTVRYFNPKAAANSQSQ